MNLRQLEYFVSVAEVGSFSKAALILNIAQPALSRQIRLLETDLRSTLLQRTGRGVVLTEAGKRLFDHALAILQQVTQAREDLEAKRDEPAGRIVVGLPPSIGRACTLPLVEAFSQQLPRARLSIVEGLSAHMAEWIATGRVDVGLLYNPEAQPAIEVTPVLDEALCVVSPAANGRRRGPRKLEEVRFADLPNYPLVMPERAHAIRKLLEARAALAGLSLAVAWEVSSVHSILDLVRAGYGNAVLSMSAVEADGPAADFEVRPLIEPRLSSTLCLAVSAHRQATPLTKHVIRLLRELLPSGGTLRVPKAALRAAGR